MSSSFRKKEVKQAPASAETSSTPVASKMCMMRLKPLAKKYRNKSLKRYQERKTLVSATRMRIMDQELGCFINSKQEWKAKVRNLEVFMYPSIALESSKDSTGEGLNDHNLNISIKPPVVTWQQTIILQNPEPNYPHPEQLRLTEEEQKRKTFERKLEFGERLLRIQMLEEQEENDGLAKAIVGSKSDIDAKTDVLEMSMAQLNHEDQRNTDGSENHVPLFEQNTYLSKKSNLFRKWSHLYASRQSNNGHDLISTDQKDLLRPTIYAQNSLDSYKDERSDEEKESKTAHRQMSPRSIYFQECIKTDSIPEPLFSRISPSGALDIHHFGINDEKAIMLAKSIKEFEALTSVNLSSNRITSKAIGEIVDALRGKEQLTFLDLSDNTIGEVGCNALAHFLPSVPNIHVLNLANTSLKQGTGFFHLSKQIEVHRRLISVNLSKNALTDDGGVLLGELIENSSCCVKELDISWNGLRRRGAKAIGQALRDNTSLRKLNLAMNRFGDDGGQEVAVALLDNAFLEDLDFSNNGLGGITAITMSYCLLHNTTLRVLNLDTNPIGHTGGKAVLASIVNGASCRMSLSGCTFENTCDKVFDCRTPCQFSPFDLKVETSPYDYVVACNLHRIASNTQLCELYNIVHLLEGSKTNVTLEYSVKKGVLVEAGTSRPWQVPRQGSLQLSCRYTPREPTQDQWLGKKGLDDMIQVIRRGITQKEVLSLLELSFIDLYITTEDALVLVEALQDLLEVTEILSWYVHQLEMLHLVGLPKRASFGSILLRCVDGENFFSLLKKLLSPEVMKVFVKQIGQEAISFNVKNPSGHYKFDLADETHRMVVIWLGLINGNEAQFSAESSRRQDTSQNGNWNNFRNERFNGRELVLDNDFIGRLPLTGILELDYVSTTRPKLPQVETMSDDEVMDLLLATGLDPFKIHGEVSRDANQTFQHQLILLHLAISGKYLTSKQVITMMNAFPKDNQSYRLKLVVSSFRGVVDLENMQEILLKLSPSDHRRAIIRLGYLNLMNPLRPHMEYDCNLHFLDERVLVKTLMDMVLGDPKDALRPDNEHSDVKLFELYAVATIPNKGRLRFRYVSPTTTKSVATPARVTMLKFFLLGTAPMQTGFKTVANVAVKKKDEEKSI